MNGAGKRRSSSARITSESCPEVPLDAARLKVLRALRRQWSNRRCALVGATALEVRLGLRWRTTQDLDLALEVTPEELSEGMETLVGWSRVSEQRWRSPEGVLVDLIPAGPELVAAGEIVWPGSEVRMSLVGFGHALRSSDEVRLGQDLTFPVAPVAVIALLKMSAYLDRPTERGKDLEDLVYILAEYIRPDDPRRYSEEVFHEELDYEQVSSFLLGKEMGKFTAKSDREVIRRFLVRVRNAGDPLGTQGRMAASLPPSSQDRVEELLGFIAVFEKGLGW